MLTNSFLVEQLEVNIPKHKIGLKGDMKYVTSIIHRFNARSK